MRKWTSWLPAARIVFFAGIVFGTPPGPLFAPPGGDLLTRLARRTDLEDLSRHPLVVLDVRYATTNNFTGQNLYGEFRACYLHKQAAKKFKRAAARLSRERPGWKLLIFDCLRPRSVQRRLWERVRGTPQQGYVANPDRGSVHNYGFAVDLSLRDAEGREVDMGTPYDSFQPLAQPRREKEFLASGRLTPTQIANRQLLRQVMTGAGFIQLPHEWWHYDALPAAQVRRAFRIVE